MLRKRQEANIVLERDKVKDLMLGSLDIEELYPSIDQKEGPKLVSEEVRKSNLKFENVDYHLAAVYLGSMLSADRQLKEGVRHLIPKRKTKTNRGRKPKVHRKKLGGPRPRKKMEDSEYGSRIGKNLDEDGPEDVRKGTGNEGERCSKWHRFQREYSTEEKRLLL